jgi:hypothetical protein
MTLTNGDLKKIKTLFKQTLDDDETLVRKDDIKHLPSKNDFCEKMDEVVGELKTVREEQPSQSKRLSDHEDRIVNIEEKLQITPSV